MTATLKLVSETQDPDSGGDFVFTVKCKKRGEMRIFVSEGSEGITLDSKTEPEPPKQPPKVAQTTIDGLPGQNATAEQLANFCEAKGITFDRRWGPLRLRGAINEWKANQ